MVKLSTYLCLSFISVFSLLYVVLSFSNYHDFQTGIDLAGYNQNVWNLSNGRLPWNSFKEFVMWGDHAHFIMLFFVPLYILWPSAKTILAIQALAYTTAAWPIFALARKKINSVFALALAYSYLAFIGGQYALDFDFHPSVLTGAALVWFVYFYFEKKYKWLWLTLALGLITREDAPTIFAMVGAWLLGREFLQKKFKHGLKIGGTTLVVSAVYFLLTVYIIMPIWTPDNAVLTYLDGYETRSVWDIGKGFFLYPDTILQNIVDTTEKRATLQTLPKAFTYLPLLSPFTWLTSAPILFARFNSPHDYRWLINNHSNANIAQILALGALFGTYWLKKILELAKLPKKPAIIALSSVLVIGLVWGVQSTAWQDKLNPLRISKKQDYFRPDEKDFADRAIAFNQLAAKIPDDADVTASAGFTAPLAQRRFIKNYENIESIPENVTYLLLSPKAYNWPPVAGEVKRDIKTLEENEEWQLIDSQADIFLYSRN